MPVKSGYLSLHNGGSGQHYEVAGTTRQYVTFPDAIGGGLMATDRAISFILPTLTFPTNTIAVSASVTGSIRQGTAPLAISGTLYAPVVPYALNFDGTIASAVPQAGYGIRVGLWDAATGGTYREHVHFTNRDTPFTVTAVSGNINFAAAGLAVTP